MVDFVKISASPGASFGAVIGVIIGASFTIIAVSFGHGVFAFREIFGKRVQCFREVYRLSFFLR